MAETTAQAPEWPVVQTDAGAVTLARCDALRARAAQWRDWAASAATNASTLGREADDHFAAAGNMLVARSGDWPVPPQLQTQLQQATALIEGLASDENRDATLKSQESAAGFFGRIGVRRDEKRLEHDHSIAADELRPLLIQIARSAPTSSIAPADAERKSAADSAAQATSLEAEVAAATSKASAWDDEARRRDAAIKQMGFDSLYESALFATTGPQPIEFPPLVLKKGEQAYLSVPATLARMATRTHYVGGSTGFSFPIGHTGIRYRVGSFRGEPVHQQSLAKLDTGTFVVTNQRVAYVGQTKATSVALGKVLHVEVYNDGLSIAREGKENPDFYLMSSPKYVVFLVNWFLAKLSGSA